MSQSVLKNILAKGILNVFNILVPFLVVPYVYRVLNPEIIGNIEYGATLYGYFGLLGALGIYHYGLREISRVRAEREKVREIYKNLFVIGLISNLASFVLYNLFVFFFIHDAVLKEIMYVTGLALVFQAISTEWVNEAHEEFRFVTIKTVVIRSINVVLIFALVRHAGDYMAYVWIVTLYWLFNYLVSLIYGQRFVRLPVRELFRHLNMRKYIVPLCYILVLNNTIILYTAADRTMLGAYCGPESVAYYTIGQKIIEIIKALLLSVVFVTLPRLSYYLEDRREAYVEGVQKVMRLLMLIVFPVAVGMFMLSEDIVWLFAGDQYMEAVPALRIFSLRVIVVSVESILYNQIIFLHRKEKVLVMLNLLCGGLNVVLNFVFLSRLNPVVAISTTLAVELLFQVLCLYYIKTRLQMASGLFDVRNVKYVLGAVSCIPIILFCHYCIENRFLFLVVSVMASVLLYGTMLVVSKDEFYIELATRMKRRKAYGDK